MAAPTNVPQTADAGLRRRNRVTGWSLGAVALVIALSVWYARTH